MRRINPKYQPPSRDILSNTLLPAWYAVEKDVVKTELQDLRDVAVTADGWTSVAQDHYWTVSVQPLNLFLHKQTHKKNRNGAWHVKL